ncbi:MAG TPA: hypothetical protein VN541_05170 [Tepidisphaeraceae bacterium]|nr:hypothetical protein [Tepidisphaeraceae bacterium]
MKVRVGADRARDLVRRMHAFVAKLPFDDVSQIFEYDPPDGKYVFERAVADKWKPGDLYLPRKRDDGQTEHVHVPGLHVICFHANIRGSETASFGLASHPPVVLHREEIIVSHGENAQSHQIGQGPAIEFNTRLRGWYSWSNFVKTQYAGNPKFGGVENFLRAHRSVFAAIDECKRLGLTTRIRDDANYWRHRNDEKLVAELKRWDELIAGFAGKLTDAFEEAGHSFVAPIKDRPDFEHLEARGADMMKKAGKGKKRKGRGKGPAAE